MKVLVCGGRDFEDIDRAWTFLDKLHEDTPITSLVNGGAPGADLLAADWARLNCLQVETFAADWARYGKAAGPLRNQRMLDEGHPDLVVALPGGRGTQDMVNRAINAEVPVLYA